MTSKEQDAIRNASRTGIVFTVERSKPLTFRCRTKAGTRSIARKLNLGYEIETPDKTFLSYSDECWSETTKVYFLSNKRRTKKK